MLERAVEHHFPNRGDGSVVAGVAEISHGGQARRIDRLSPEFCPQSIVRNVAGEADFLARPAQVMIRPCNAREPHGRCREYGESDDAGPEDDRSMVHWLPLLPSSLCDRQALEAT